MPWFITPLRHSPSCLIFRVESGCRQTYTASQHWSTSKRVNTPFPTLLVNLVTLSLTPNTVFLTKLAAPCYKLRRVRAIQKRTDLCYSNTQLSVSMHYHPLERFIENIGHTRADISEKSNRVTDEVCGTQYAVELA